MANWITIKQLSEKRGIAESDLRTWANLGYIASSRIENVLMIDDESLTQYLDVHQTKDLGENYLEKIIKEKELEREVLLSQCDDELFLLKTQKLHQPLFHILIQELGQLITDDHEREIFLSVSGGEPIARVAKRNKMTYAQVATCYSSILRTLGEHKGRIATFRSRTMELMFDKCNAVTPVNTPLSNLVGAHAYNVLYGEMGFRTVRDLLQYATQNGWQSLRRFKGMGLVTYKSVMNALRDANFIIVRKDGNIELSPEIAALVI